MPIIARAIKKMYHDRRRTKVTSTVRENLREITKSMRKNPSKKALAAVFQALDKAAKRKVIHPNKASRLKSRLSKLLKK
jgi:small subunit ribosomal protein S20